MLSKCAVLSKTVIQVTSYKCIKIIIVFDKGFKVFMILHVHVKLDV